MSTRIICTILNKDGLKKVSKLECMEILLFLYASVLGLVVWWVKIRPFSVTGFIPLFLDTWFGKQQKWDFDELKKKLSTYQGDT